MLLVCWEEGELLKKDVLDTAENALLAFALSLSLSLSLSLCIYTYDAPSLLGGGGAAEGRLAGHSGRRSPRFRCPRQREPDPAQSAS
jgi:hypothetical protein